MTRVRKQNKTRERESQGKLFLKKVKKKKLNEFIGTLCLLIGAKGMKWLKGLIELRRNYSVVSGRKKSGTLIIAILGEEKWRFDQNFPFQMRTSCREKNTCREESSLNFQWLSPNPLPPELFDKDKNTVNVKFIIRQLNKRECFSFWHKCQKSLPSIRT